MRTCVRGRQSVRRSVRTRHVCVHTPLLTRQCGGSKDKWAIVARFAAEQPGGRAADLRLGLDGERVLLQARARHQRPDDAPVKGVPRTCARQTNGNVFRGGCFSLISLGGQAQHVHPVGPACGEPNEIGLTPSGVKLNGPRRAPVTSSTSPSPTVSLRPLLPRDGNVSLSSRISLTAAGRGACKRGQLQVTPRPRQAGGAGSGRRARRAVRLRLAWTTPMTTTHTRTHTHARTHATHARHTTNTHASAAPCRIAAPPQSHAGAGAEGGGREQTQRAPSGSDTTTRSLTPPSPKPGDGMEQLMGPYLFIIALGVTGESTDRGAVSVRTSCGACCGWVTQR